MEAGVRPEQGMPLKIVKTDFDPLIVKAPYQEVDEQSGRYVIDRAN
jgi:hypothetical protein